MRIYLLFIGILFNLHLAAQDQQQRFGAALVLGVNAAQIDGDLYAGYNKLGLQGGIRGITILNEKSEISMGLLFSQRGSQNELNPDDFTERIKIHLNYVAVPVAYHYKDWLVDDYYRLQVHAGLSYGRLLSTKIQDLAIDELANEFNQNDISWIAGINYYFNRNFSLGFRYNRSITLLFNNRKNPNINANSLLSHFLSFQGVYQF